MFQPRDDKKSYAEGVSMFVDKAQPVLDRQNVVAEPRGGARGVRSFSKFTAIFPKGGKAS
jgi:hypothetical protein